jgi:hypothetical protein
VDSGKIRNARRGFIPAFHKKILQRTGYETGEDTLPESSSLSVSPGMVVKYYFFWRAFIPGTENLHLRKILIFWLW